MRRLCVFCGSRLGATPAFSEAARVVGETLARRGIGLVYGGGNVGLMGVLADAVLARGGEVIGVIPHGLEKRELAHPNATEMRVVGSMHERKSTMAELADGFVALPGGFGTLEELFEVVTWAQLGIHRKPCALLNVKGYWDAMLTLLDNMVREGFADDDSRSLVLVDESIDALIDRMAAWSSPVRAKWLEPEET